MIQCSKCANENADNAHFCGFCGARLQGAGPSQTIFGMQSAIPVAAPAAPAPSPVAPKPSPQAAPTPAAPPQQPSFQVAAPAPVATAAAASFGHPTQDAPATVPLDALPVAAPAPVAAAPAPVAAAPAPVAAAPAPAPVAAAPAPAAAAPAPAASPDKDDEKAFFGASLSKYDLQGLDRSELIMDDFDQRRKSPIGAIIVIALIIGAIAGAVVYFLVLS